MSDGSSGCASHRKSCSTATRACNGPRASRRCSRRSSMMLRQGMGSPPSDGILLVDKPAGMTSHDVVATTRRSLGERRVGHAGTLDPFATGLLVLLVGRATRLLPYIDGEPKVYEAVIRFGTETDTDDSTGIQTRQAGIPAREAVERAIQ